jgi:hypothetical protein
MTDPVEVFDFDFTVIVENQNVLQEWSAVESGTCNAIVYWYDLDIDISSRDLKSMNPAMQYIDPIEMKVGECFDVKIMHNRTKIMFRVEEPVVEIDGVEKAIKKYQRPKIHRNLASKQTHMSLNCKEKNELYDEIIGSLNFEDCQKENPSVLVIGCNMAMTAMNVAKQYENADVYCCDISKNNITISRGIVEDNGLSDRITLINKDCRLIKIGEDIPERVDVVISDNFNVGLLNDGALYFADYAKQNLLVEGGSILPSNGKIIAKMIELRLDKIEYEENGVDVSLTNQYRWSPESISVDLKKVDYRTMSEEFEVFNFKFGEVGGLESGMKKCGSKIVKNGIVSAIAYTFELGGSYRDSKSMIHFLPEAEVEEGNELVVKVEQNGLSIRFDYDEENIKGFKMVEESRYDEDWMNNYSQLQEKSQEVIREAVSDEGKFKSLIHFLTKIASQSGNFNIDGVYASKFATSFFA